MKIIDSIKYSAFAFLAVMICFSFWWGYKYYLCSGPEIDSTGYSDLLSQIAEENKKYIKDRNLNNDYCVLVDYGIPSGTPRVFVWSYKENKVIFSTYTMHGPGLGSSSEKAVYSNKEGSLCSALGHFVITREHGRQQKRGFRLKGLDKVNKTAYTRGIMLHSSRWVDTHCWMKYIPLNSLCCLGCVTVSSRGFDYLEKLVYVEKKKMLLYSFDSTIKTYNYYVNT